MIDIDQRSYVLFMNIEGSADVGPVVDGFGRADSQSDAAVRNRCAQVLWSFFPGVGLGQFVNAVAARIKFFPPG